MTRERERERARERKVGRGKLIPDCLTLKSSSTFYTSRLCVCVCLCVCEYACACVFACLSLCMSVLVGE